MGNGNSKALEKALAESSIDERFYGLENFGNTCYCNSVLQALYFCKPFREQVLRYSTQLYRDSPENLLTCLTDLFVQVRREQGGAGDQDAREGRRLEPTNARALFDVVHGSQINSAKKKTGVISPKKFVQRLKRDNDLFSGYMHQASDARVWRAPRLAVGAAGEAHALAQLPRPPTRLLRSSKPVAQTWWQVYDERWLLVLTATYGACASSTGAPVHRPARAGRARVPQLRAQPERRDPGGGHQGRLQGQGPAPAAAAHQHVDPRHFPGQAGERDALPALRDRHVPRGGLHGPQPGDRAEQQPHQLPAQLQVRRLGAGRAPARFLLEAGGGSQVSGSGIKQWGTRQRRRR